MTARTWYRILHTGMDHELIWNPDMQFVRSGLLVGEDPRDPRRYAVYRCRLCGRQFQFEIGPGHQGDVHKHFRRNRARARASRWRAFAAGILLVLPADLATAHLIGRPGVKTASHELCAGIAVIGALAALNSWRIYRRNP